MRKQLLVDCLRLREMLDPPSRLNACLIHSRSRSQALKTTAEEVFSTIAKLPKFSRSYPRCMVARLDPPLFWALCCRGTLIVLLQILARWLTASTFTIRKAIQLAQGADRRRRWTIKSSRTRAVRVAQSQRQVPMPYWKQRKSRARAPRTCSRPYRLEVVRWVLKAVEATKICPK